MSDWLGTRDTATRLGVTLRTLYRFIDTGQLPAYKMGRVIRLRAEDVTRFGAQRFPPGSGLEDLYPDDPGGASGDREPRKARPSGSAGSAALPIPEG
jgi:excisionase family DNA binding protein